MCFNDVTCGKNWNDTWYDDIIQSWLVCKYRNMARVGPYCVVTSGQALASGLPEFAPQIFSFLRNVPRMPIIFNSSLWIQRMATGNEALRRAVIASTRGTIQLGDNVLPVMDANLSCRDFQIHPGPSSQQTTETTTSDQFWSSIYPIKRVELCSPLQARSYKTME